jgi:hypothetical protein
VKIPHRSVLFDAQAAARKITPDQPLKPAIPLMDRSLINDRPNSATSRAQISSHLFASRLIDDLVTAAHQHQQWRARRAAVGEAGNTGAIKRDMPGKS